DLLQTVAWTFFNGQLDVNGFAGCGLERKVPADTAGVVDLRLRIGDQCLEVSLGLVKIANTLGVFIQLSGIVGASEEVLQEDRVRNTNRLQVLHRTLKFPTGYCLIAYEGDLPDFYLWTLFNYEGQGDGCRRNRADFRADCGELTPVR